MVIHVRAFVVITTFCRRCEIARVRARFRACLSDIVVVCATCSCRLVVVIEFCARGPSDEPESARFRLFSTSCLPRVRVAAKLTVLLLHLSLFGLSL